MSFCENLCAFLLRDFSNFGLDPRFHESLRINKILTNLVMSAEIDLTDEFFNKVLV